MNLDKRDLIIYDFETNGLLDHPTLQPIEVAIIHIDCNNNYTEYNKFVKLRDINEKLTPIITKITGITDQTLIDEGIDLDQMLDETQHYFTDNDNLISGHNILRFDNIILWNLLKARNGAGFRGSQIFDTGGHFKGELLGWKKFPNDSWDKYHKKVLDVKSFKKWNLTTACKHYDIPMEAATHRAIADVRYNLQVFLKQIQGLNLLPERFKEFMI